MIGQPLSALKRADALLWSVKVGRMHSRNNIVVRKNKAFLSSSGEQWNVPDELDGVYCVDLQTESTVWFARTYSDANEISLIGNVILVGTDQGKVFAINADTGAVLEEQTVRGPVYTSAIELEIADRQIGILISKVGEVVQYDVDANKFSILGALPHSIRANPAKISSNSFLVGSEEGAVTLVEIDEQQIKAKDVFDIPPHRASGPSDYSLHIRGISSIIALDDRVIVSYARNTYDRRPPILCFSLRTGKKIWDGGRIQTASKNEAAHFGNSRVTPVVWKNLLISTFSYNDGVHAFSIETGKWVWRQRLDDSYFQNWSSPIVNEDLLYVARINGVLSIIDLRTKKLLSSYSVEVLDVSLNSASPKISDGREPWPNNHLEFESGPYPGQQIVAGICSTPAVWNGKILIGTTSGKLCCLREPIMGS
jgi:outer membrane protein assembly factor BamB